MLWIAAILLQTDLTFKESSPIATDAELKKRLKIEGGVPPYDLSKEKFRAVVPKEYSKDEAWGLFVWIDAGDEPGFPKELDWARHKLIGVGACKTGNERPVYDRLRLTLDAVHGMKAAYSIDPQRIFISGISGGGRIASMIGVAYADVFTGTLPLCGANFYKPIPLEGNKVLLAYYKPMDSILKTAKASGRFVLVTGEKDFNRNPTQLTYEKGFKAEGFKHVLYLDIPGMGHSIPSGEWLDKALDFLDGK